MVTIEPHISYLVGRRDCVVVPGIGAFLAAYEPARYDAGRLEYAPPRRTLCFNADVACNDGLLAASVARRQGVTLERATAMVAADAEAVRKSLQSGAAWTVDRVGCLTMTADGAMEFIPVADGGSANDAYRLLPVIDNLHIYESAVTDASAANILAEAAPRRRRLAATALRAAASVAVAGALLWTVFGLMPSIDTSGARSDSASVAPAKAGAVQELVSQEPTAGQDLIITIPEAEPLVKAPATIKEPSCYLIVASFVTRKQAQQHIDYLGDTSLGILEADGRYRVYAATADTYEACQAKRDVARFSDAWVYTRN